MDSRARFRARSLGGPFLSPFLMARFLVARTTCCPGARARHRERTGSCFLAPLFALLLLGLESISRAAPPTTITLDGSLGTAGAIPGSNHLFTIAPSMGKSIGPNLFQSFGAFNLGTGDVASFGANAGTQNVIARVTGGAASTIDGTLACPVNLFFLNPAGVIFDANAQVDVTGSFVVSTASYAKLSDGNIFYADVDHPVADAGLTAAPVSAFGFLSPTPQPISFTGSQITAPTGAGIDVIGGDISLNGATLLAPGGILTLFSAASTGEVPFSLVTPSAPPGTGYAAAPFAQFGKINITNQSQAEIDGNGGGSLVIRGGQITVDNSDVTSGNYANVAGGNISVQADQLTLNNGGFIATKAFDAQASANAGSINVNVAGAIEASGTDSEISSDTLSAGNSGDVSVAAGSIDLEAGGEIYSVADLGSTGNGGAVTVNAGSMSMEGNARLSSFTAGAGNAGSVNLTLTSGALTMRDTSGIIADTYTTGNGGNITVSALQISMTGQSVISASTVASSGKGGTINILNNQFLSIQGSGTEEANSLGIVAQSVVSGDAGVINVNSQNVSLGGGAVISSSSFFEGKGGQVMVNSSQVQLSGGSQISAISGLTNAGSVQITASNWLSMSGDSSISTSAGETGGAVTLEVGQLLYMLDSSITAYAGYPVNLQGAPLPPLPPNPNLKGGNINIDPQFVVLDNSLISANDLSPGGHDGNIVNTSDFFFTDDSTLHATGTIETTAPDLDLAGSLAFLPANLVDASTQLRERCELATNHEFSTFIVVGRGGIENGPEELQPDFGLSLHPGGSGAGESISR